MAQSDDPIRLQLFQTIMDRSSEGIVFVDSENRIRYWSEAAQQLLGVPSSEFADHQQVNACVTVEPNRLETLRADPAQHVSDSIRFTDSDGEETQIDRVINVVEVAGESWLFVTLSNGLLRTPAETELHRLAQTDQLSELLNRRGFQAALEENLDRQLALAIVDVDFFKRINDQGGHETGDRAIQWIAKKLSEAFPQAIAIGRLGGDEFGVVLEVTAHAEIAALFKNFCEAVESDPIAWHPPGMTISIGVAVSTAAGVSARDLLSSADRAMYQSKHEGRSRVTVVGV